jgi:hypothetical protein
VGLVVGSAAPTENIDFTLDGLDLRQRFDAIAGAADVARQAAPGRVPERRAAGRRPAGNSIVFEDAPLGVEAARRAGMRAVVLTTTLPAEAFAAFDNVIAIVPISARSMSTHCLPAAPALAPSSIIYNEEDHDYGYPRTSRRPDENKIIAERRAKLAACANKASPSRTTSARAQGGRSARAIRRKTREELEANPSPWCWPAA